MKLEIASFNHNPELTEITALKGMPLKTLEFDYTKVAAPTPLEGCHSLEVLKCSVTRVTNLKPLKGLKLKELWCSLNKGAKDETISDLAPLHGMKLEKLACAACAVVDFNVIKEMPIHYLQIGETPPIEFAFLRHLPLKELWIDHTALQRKGWIPGEGQAHHPSRVDGNANQGFDICQADALAEALVQLLP